MRCSLNLHLRSAHEKPQQPNRFDSPTDPSLFKESFDYSKGTILGFGYLLLGKFDKHYSEKETEESYSWSDLVSGKILNSEHVIFQFSSLRLTVIDLS